MDKILSMSEVRAVTGLSRSTIWRAVRSGRFPPPIELSANRIGWPESVVKEWRDKRRLRTYGGPYPKPSDEATGLISPSPKAGR